MIHYTEQYLINPTHKLTVNLVGCGGTGSQVLSMLAKMNVALISLGHPGLQVTVYDADIVSEANQGRQLFSPADIGVNKAMVSVTRVNRFFGLDWDAVQENYETSIENSKKANILITCVDTAAARVKIAKGYGKGWFTKEAREPYNKEYYWLDFGNLKKTGQCIIGTAGEVKQPDQPDTCEYLMNVVQYFPEIKKIKEKNQGPSCSIAQALSKQDLFINSTLANHGMSLLWNLITDGRITNQGCYLNLKTSTVNPLPFK